MGQLANSLVLRNQGLGFPKGAQSIGLKHSPVRTPIRGGIFL